MALKRKRSLTTFSPKSDSSASSVFTHESSSPTGIPFFYTQTKPTSSSQSADAWKTSDRIISNNINSRTMKRHRDNRPDEDQVHRTIEHFDQLTETLTGGRNNNGQTLRGAEAAAHVKSFAFRTPRHTTSPQYRPTATIHVTHLLATSSEPADNKCTRTRAEVTDTYV